MLTLDHISKTYRVGAFGSKKLVAVRDVTFTIEPGEVVSLIGESGSGKSTIGRMILRLSPLTSGVITLDGADISSFDHRALKGYYASVQGVFQDPFSSYNPIFKADRVLRMIKEGYFPHVAAATWREKVEGALEAAASTPPTSSASTRTS